MQIQGTTVLVTGSSRGLGRHLVDTLLERGAAKVYAASRTPSPASDDRVTAITLDLTDPKTIAAAARAASDATILINNAGTAAFAGPLEAAPDAVRAEMAVNYDGTFD